MQYSAAALRALLLGLVGVCQVAAFGTMPGFDKLGVVKTMAESAGGDAPLKLDENFCTNSISKVYLGAAYCNTIDTEESCGGGSDVYRRSDGSPSKYDICRWRDGACLMAGLTYWCGAKCFEQTGAVTDEGSCTTDDGEAGTLEKCGESPEAECIPTGTSWECKTSNVMVDEDGDGLYERVTRYELVRFVSSSRRHLTTCKGNGIISEQVLSATTTKVKKHTCVSTTDQGCKCEEKTSIVITDNSNPAAPDSTDCVDVKAQCWGTHHDCTTYDTSKVGCQVPGGGSGQLQDCV